MLRKVITYLLALALAIMLYMAIHQEPRLTSEEYVYLQELIYESEKRTEVKGISYESHTLASQVE